MGPSRGLIRVAAQVPCAQLFHPAPLSTCTFVQPSMPLKSSLASQTLRPAPIPLHLTFATSCSRWAVYIPRTLPLPCPARSALPPVSTSCSYPAAPHHRLIAMDVTQLPLRSFSGHTRPYPQPFPPRASTSCAQRSIATAAPSCRSPHAGPTALPVRAKAAHTPSRQALTGVPTGRTQYAPAAAARDATAAASRRSPTASARGQHTTPSRHGKSCPCCRRHPSCRCRCHSCCSSQVTAGCQAAISAANSGPATSTPAVTLPTSARHRDATRTQANDRQPAATCCHRSLCSCWQLPPAVLSRGAPWPSRAAGAPACGCSSSSAA